MTTSPLNPSAPTGPARPRREGLPPAVTVPRRFGMSIMLLAMTLFSLTFFVLRLLGFPGPAVVIICGFFVAISIAQMIWVRSPRKASIITGLVYSYAVALALMGWVVLVYRTFDLFTLILLPLLGPIGALFGYLAGGLMAGIFLLMGWEPNTDGALVDQETAAQNVSRPKALEPPNE